MREWIEIEGPLSSLDKLFNLTRLENSYQSNDNAMIIPQLQLGLSTMYNIFSRNKAKKPLKRLATIILATFTIILTQREEISS